MRNYRRYEVWQLGMRLVEDVYKLSARLLDHERYGLQSQIRRASVSIPSNVAEGCSRTSDKEFGRFLEFSIGSSFELETQLILAKNVGFLMEDELDSILELLAVIQKKLNALITKMKRERG